MKPVAYLLPFLLTATPSHAGAADQPVPQVAELSCGGTAFRMESAAFQGRQAPLAPVRQTLTLTNRGRTRQVALERQGTVTVDERTVQRAYVSSWACVRASTGRSYVDLEYDCAIDQGEKGACLTGEEWFHLLDPTGRTLDNALQDGTARDRLDARLGLTEVMAAGVPMRGVLSTF